MISGIVRGALYAPLDHKQLGSVVSAFPGEAEGESEGESQLFEVALQAHEGDSSVILSQQHYGPQNACTCDVIAVPLLVGNETVAVVAIMVSVRAQAQQRAVLQLLQWGGLWVESLVQHPPAIGHKADAFPLEFMSTVLQHSSLQAMAMEIVNQLADKFDCERVSLGLRRGLSLRLQALSHVVSFDSRAEIARRIEAAMEEAVDQASTMIYPDKTGGPLTVSRAHAELASFRGNGVVCTIPLQGITETIGALTLERSPGHSFDHSTVALCEAVGHFIGLEFERKQREQRPPWGKTKEAFLDWASNVFGVAHLKPKLLLLSVAMLMVVLSLVSGTYKVTARASIEGTVRQALVAPQDSYVKRAEVRAGDLVKEGQLIALLDDRNLQLEHQKWQSERNKIEKEYQDALAKRDRSELSILRAQIDQVDAELQQLHAKIMRTKLRAPFEGVVVSGDLSQSLGAPVKIGQVLFEIAPLDSYRVVLEVDDHDMAGVDVGKSGHLLVAALPDSFFAISIDQVVPVAVSSEAKNFFRVEASLNEFSKLLRPGMSGVAKIEVGERKLLWIWTHTLMDRLRLWFWSVGL
ncbi:MAG: efflux RND transporter periplasmic adaptor subunit [Porticoccus sp.]|nr:efflux RND transporter periplasmic adaptor subunit [Porticoccus sp.]